MFGESFLICAVFDEDESDKIFTFPNANFNSYPDGKSIMNTDDSNQKIKVSGKLNETNIFLRGGYIVPYQNTWDSYIMNSNKLREERLNLIINIDEFKKSNGTIFFDNDGISPIQRKEYIRVDLSYKQKKLSVNTEKSNIEKYDYNDHILGQIELWRADEIFKINNDKKKEIKVRHM